MSFARYYEHQPLPLNNTKDNGVGDKASYYCNLQICHLRHPFKYTNRQIHKYAKSQIHKYMTTQKRQWSWQQSQLLWQ